MTGRTDSPLRVGVLHGPNLDRLGTREPERYGTTTLAEIDALLERRAEERGAVTTAFQSNSEGELIDWVHDVEGEVDGWLVNAAGLTHSSVSLRDALVATGRPFVEVHLSNIFAREPFRRRSLFADAALGVVTGFRAESYLLGLDGLLAHLSADG